MRCGSIEVPDSTHRYAEHSRENRTALVSGVSAQQAFSEAGFDSAERGTNHGRSDRPKIYLATREPFLLYLRCRSIKRP